MDKYMQKCAENFIIWHNISNILYYTYNKTYMYVFFIYIYI